MTGLDVVLLAALAIFAFAGFRRGFIVGGLGFVGFVLGGAVGMLVVPVLIGDRPLAAGAAAVALVSVLACATIGQALASWVGTIVRSRVSWQPARRIDAVAGALLSAGAMLLVLWFLALAVVSGPFPTLTKQVRDSQVLTAVDEVMPEAARQLFADFRAAVDDSVFPQVFGALGGEQVRPVGPADEALLRDPDVVAARRSVVQVAGLAEACREQVTGTAFVVADERVVTNAHVVAGVDRPVVVVGAAGLGRAARVVLFDPKVDLAVLAVPGLDAPPLDLHDEPLRRGDQGVVAGFPGGGPYTTVASRVRDRQSARGRDIYDAAPVTREVYALRSTVRPGNSGGPLLLSDGSVAGVVFAASVDDPDTGYALTMGQVRADIRRGVSANARVSTGRCT